MRGRAGRWGCTLVVVLVAALPEEHRLDHVCLRAAAPAVGLHAAAQRRPQPRVQRHAQLGVERAAAGGARAVRAAARLLGVLAGQHVGHEGVALALREDRRDEEVPVLGVALALLARELHRGRTPKPPAHTLLLGVGIQRRRDLASSITSITEGRRWPAVECSG